MARHDPFAGLYSGGDSQSVFAGLGGDTLSKQQQDDQKKQAQLDKFKQVENKKNAQKGGNLLDLFNFAKPVSQGGINIFADAGNFIKDNVVKPVVNDAETFVNQTAAKASYAQAGGNNSGNSKTLDSLLTQYKNDLKKGDITQAQYDEVAKKIQTRGQKNDQAQKTAEAQTGVKMDQNSGALAAINTIGNLTGTDVVANATVNAAKNTGKKVIDTAIEGVTKSKAKQAATETAQDAARLKQAGFDPTVGTGVENAAKKVVDTQPNEVVQTVGKNGEKTFYRIPSGQRDTIVNSIDNARDGTAIAGQNIDGSVTHVTARTPEDMLSRGFKDGGVYNGTGESRYVSKTLPESDFVHVDTKGKLGATYNKVSNQQQAEQSLKLLDAEGIDNFTTNTYAKLQNKELSSQAVVDAQAAAQALEKRGGEADLQRAADIYNTLSEKLSKAGQTVQAASILAKQTPQGLRYWAQNQFKKNGVDFSPELQKELDMYVKDVENAVPKSHAEAIARDNVQYFVASHIPSSTKDKIINFWRAGLLTAPTTTAGAIAGNLTQAAQKNLITDPVSVLADMVMSLKTGKRTVARASFGSSEKGAAEGAKVLTTKQYRKTGFNPLDPAQRSNKYLDTATSHMTNYGTGRVGKVAGAYVNGVYRVMGAADLPFRAAAQAKALSSLGRAEAINQGLKGKEAKAFIDEFVKNPPKAAEERAAKEAEAAVFGNDTELGKVATKLSNSFGGLGQILVPFAKVPSAVATKVITSTPLGTASELIRQIVKVKKGGSFDQRAMAKAIGEGTTGVPIIGAGYALAANGDITGGYPSTQAERDQWQAEGKKPNSIRIDGKWYSLNYIQPFATLLATGAKAREATDAGLDLGEVVAQASAGAGQSVLSQSFLQGLSSAIDAVKNPADFGGKFIANTASGVVPNIIRSATSALDPVKRDAQGAVEGLMSGIPGLRQQLPAKLDSSGQVVQNKAGFFDQFANPLKPTPSVDTVDSEFNQKAVLPAKRLQDVRKKEINRLLADNRVQAAQRKIDEYNQQLTKVIGPYVSANSQNFTSDQVDKISSLFLGKVYVNDKGRPYISTRKDL